MLFNKGVFCVRRKNEIAVDKILDCAKEEFIRPAGTHIRPADPPAY